MPRLWGWCQPLNTLVLLQQAKHTFDAPKFIGLGMRYHAIHGSFCIGKRWNLRVRPIWVGSCVQWMSELFFLRTVWTFFLAYKMSQREAKTMAPKALGFCHVPRREFGTPGAAAMAMGASFVSVAPTGHLRVRSWAKSQPGHWVVPHRDSAMFSEASTSASSHGRVQAILTFQKLISSEFDLKKLLAITLYKQLPTHKDPAQRYTEMHLWQVDQDASCASC